MQTKLHTENIGGNLHQAATVINKWGWAEYVVTLDYSGGTTVAVFKMPAEKVHEIRENSPYFNTDPHYDDYHGAPDPYSSTAISGAIPASEPASTTEPPATTKSRGGRKKAVKPEADTTPDASARQGIDNVSETGNGAYTQQQTDANTDAQFANQQQGEQQPNWGNDQAQNQQQQVDNEDLPDWARS